MLTVTLSSTTTAGGQLRRMPTDQRGGDLTPPLADTLHEMSCDQFHDGLCATPIPKRAFQALVDCAGGSVQPLYSVGSRDADGLGAERLQ